MVTSYSAGQKSKIVEDVVGNVKSYNEIVDFLSSCTPIEYGEMETLKVMFMDLRISAKLLKSISTP